MAWRSRIWSLKGMTRDGSNRQKSNCTTSKTTPRNLSQRGRPPAGGRTSSNLLPSSSGMAAWTTFPKSDRVHSMVSPSPRPVCRSLALFAELPSRKSYPDDLHGFPRDPRLRSEPAVLLGGACVGVTPARRYKRVKNSSCFNGQAFPQPGSWDRETIHVGERQDGDGSKDKRDDQHALVSEEREEERKQKGRRDPLSVQDSCLTCLTLYCSPMAFSCILSSYSNPGREDNRGAVPAMR